MQLKAIRGRGWLPFANEFNVDLDSVNGTIVAVTGPNGAGKSSFLELFPGCLFRRLPTRGSLKDFAASRDAFIECEVVNGSQYRIRQTVDGVSGKSETSLTHDGRAVLSSGKVSEYQKWADKNLPALPVFLNSLFAAQGSKGLLGMDPAERKAVILRVLGLERLEALSQLARQNKSEADKELAGVRARIEEIGTANVEHCDKEAVLIKQSLSKVELTLANAEEVYQGAFNQAQGIARQQAEYDTLVARRAELESQVQKLYARIADLDERLTNNRAVVADAVAIRAAVARDAELSNLIAALKSEESSLRVTSSELEGKYNALRQEERTHSEKREALRRTASNADMAIAEKPAVLAASLNLSEFEAQLAVVESGLTAADEELARLQGEALIGKDGRISGLRTGLRRIRKIVEEVERGPEIATLTLLEDDKAEVASETLPERTQTAANRRNALYQEQRNVQRLLRENQSLAARLPEIEGAEKSKADALEGIEALDAVTFVGIRSDLDRASDEVSNALNHTRMQIQALGNEQAALGPLVKKAGALDSAETRIEELLHERSGIERELEEVEHKRDGIEPVDPPNPIDLSTYETAVTRARATVQEYQTKLALAGKELEAARDKETRRAVLVEKSRTLEETVADWTRLSQDLGRDGLQALEIDCAGPEITVLANDLLRSCGDTRFTVSVETTRMDSTGKRELEGCEIVVMDSKNGQTKTAEQLSGGEAVFVGEAISLSLAMLGCRRSGASSPTIVRDESGAALDPERGPMYVAMLRRAAEIVGASKILFVSHAPDLQALADSTIRISNGEVTVV